MFSEIQSGCSFGQPLESIGWPTRLASVFLP
ncbi:MAG: hypothetical protein RL016_572, partial [Actinomycetota bacterium]